MRSVGVFFQSATLAEVQARLDALLPGQREPWLYHSDDSTGLLYVRILTPDQLRQWASEVDLPFTPASALSVDVSGRFPGDKEVGSLLGHMLHAFSGVASDDYTAHAWTLAEIRDGVMKEGHPFFDYAGWHSRLSRGDD